MKRAAWVVMLLVVGGCGFAQKHPGVTIGIVAGTLGFGACELSVEKIGTCSAIGGAVGLALGGITGLVTAVADTSAHALDLEDEEQERVPTGTPPPPGLPPDAGVPETLDGATSDVPPDAGMSPPDAAL